ncbi:hypothetical protein [Lentibacillus cibarius]|uniref:Uncharacterized protein n=1 Tax=Lentibacillus cibarius TaxID=2583219 RepID=A0A5S3QIS1_9BACI|nr:hypothetical protein [Lentibacillus cibarius]TMN21822.1 hypothetical protein FFL34_06630 [Lentibacillus cibarius]
MECFNGVSAINETILPSASVDTDAYQLGLGLEYKDTEGNVIQADKLPEDLKVSFADSKDVFAEDGTIANKENIPSANNSITVVATVSSESQDVNLTEEFTVNVVNAGDWATVSGSQLKIDNDIDGDTDASYDNTVNTAVVGDDMILFPTVATQNDGTVLSEENDNAVQDWNGQVESVETSDVTVVTVSKDASGDTVTLRPISAGEATVTVELASGL